MHALYPSKPRHLLSIIVLAPPLLFTVVVMVDFPTPVRRGQGTQQRAASPSNQSTAKRIIAQQVTSRRSGTRPRPQPGPAARDRRCWYGRRRAARR